MLSTPPHRKGFRVGLYAATFGALSLSSFAALISLALIGRSVNQDMIADSNAARTKNNTIRNLEDEKDIAKARAGQGITGSRVVLTGYVYQDTFLEDVIADYGSGFTGRRGRVTITDQTRRVVGYFENGFVCDTVVAPSKCIPLNR